MLWPSFLRNRLIFSLCSSVIFSLAFSQGPSISIEKYTAGHNADQPPGPNLAVGDLVEWTYVVTNTGSTVLTDVYVLDDQNLDIRCPQSSLMPGESFTCIARGTVEPGQYQNEGIAFGTAPDGQIVSDSDLSHYYGGILNSSIQIEKYTNGQDADYPPGPIIPQGDPVTWTYEVTNTGQTTLSGVTISDNKGVTISCPQTTLDPGETMVCTASGTAIAGPYENIGSVTAFDPDGGVVSDFDVSHYTGDAGQPGIALVLYVNGDDANSPPGPTVDEGSQVNWTYEVTNTGDVTLSNIRIFDTLALSGRCDSSDILPGETILCYSSAPAELGLIANEGTVQADTPGGQSVSASDLSYYTGEAVGLPDLVIEKSTNGYDADVAPGPTIPEGDPVTWEYVITNNSTETMVNISVIDDQGVSIDCGFLPGLSPGQSWTCTGSGTAILGQYSNTATVTATDITGQISYSATDMSHYFGEAVNLDIALETRISGDDADSSPGPSVPVDSLLYVTFEVTNLSDVPIENIVVTNDHSLQIRCPFDILQPGESMECFARESALSGPQLIMGSVSAQTSSGHELTAYDPGYYTGVEGLVDITIQKLTNGDDADEAPGPSIYEGDPVVWAYEVTNTGQETLTNVTVTDDEEFGIQCPSQELAPGESMICTLTRTARFGPYQNMGRVEAISESGFQVSAVDPSHYTGIAKPAEISLKKRINGLDADDPPGPTILEGEPIEWSFEITNTGGANLQSIVIVDDMLGPVSCPGTTLSSGETMVCTVTGTAESGQQVNNASVSAMDTHGNSVSDTDSAYYTGEPRQPSVSLEKHTNGDDADLPPGPSIQEEDAVVWTFILTNTGNVPLTNISLDDNVLGPITCPGTELQPGESMTCSYEGTAEYGQHENVATVIANDNETEVNASDSSHYLGTAIPPQISIEKTTNGMDADAEPGPILNVGDPVTWEYTVTNTGIVPLTGIAILDDKQGSISCGQTSLAPGESMTCTAQDAAVRWQYENVASVTAYGPHGDAATGNDASHYFGFDDDSEGCSHGFWKSHPENWIPTGYLQDQHLEDVFVESQNYPELAGQTLAEALRFKGGPGALGGAQILLRTATAALLNSAHPDVAYSYSPTVTLQLVNQALASGDRETMLDLKDHLEDLFEDCPLGGKAILTPIHPGKP